MSMTRRRTPSTRSTASSRASQERSTCTATSSPGMTMAAPYLTFARCAAIPAPPFKPAGAARPDPPGQHPPPVRRPRSRLRFHPRQGTDRHLRPRIWTPTPGQPRTIPHHREARPHQALLAEAGNRDELPWTLARRRRSLIPGASSHDVPAHRGHRRRADDQPARDLRRVAQLGLPLLMAARLQLHRGCPLSLGGRLRRRPVHQLADGTVPIGPPQDPHRLRHQPQLIRSRSTRSTT